MLRTALTFGSLMLLAWLFGCSSHATVDGGVGPLLFEFSRDEGPNIGGYGLLAKLSTPRSKRGARWTVRVFNDGRVESRVCGGRSWKKLRGGFSGDEIELLREQRDAVSRLAPKEVAEGLASEHHAYNELVVVEGDRGSRYQAVVDPADDVSGAAVLAAIASLLEERFSLPRIGDC